MRQIACLLVNPITVDSYALLSNCTAADDKPELKRMMIEKNVLNKYNDGPTLNDGLFIKFSQVGWAWCYVFGLARRGSTSGFL